MTLAWFSMMKMVKSSATMYSMVIKSLFNFFCQPAQEISTAEAMNYPTAGKGHPRYDRLKPEWVEDVEWMTGE